MLAAKYFRFSVPSESKSDLTKEGLGIKLLKMIVPKANPDFEDVYANVVQWSIEYYVDAGYINREIAYDAAANIVAIAPYKDNLGYWTDSDTSLEELAHFFTKEINHEMFEKDWNQFNS